MSTLYHLLGLRDPGLRLERHEQAVPTTSSTVAWIIVPVVGGIVFSATVALVTVLFTRRRLRQRQRQAEHQLYPYLNRDGHRTRRKPSATDLLREEEEQRRQMIRKSLASRSTASSRSDFAQTAEQYDRELAEMERQESVRLRDDWKRWEARERRERSLSGGHHPALGAAGGVPILAVPSPAMHRSRGRTSLTTPPPSPPLVPPRHPGRCSLS